MNLTYFALGYIPTNISIIAWPVVVRSILVNVLSTSCPRLSVLIAGYYAIQLERFIDLLLVEQASTHPCLALVDQQFYSGDAHTATHLLLSNPGIS